MSSSVDQELLRNARPRFGVPVTATSQVATNVTVFAGAVGKRIRVFQLSISCLNNDGSAVAQIQIRDSIEGNLQVFRCRPGATLTQNIYFGNDPLLLSSGATLQLLVSGVTTNHITDVSAVVQLY